MLLSTESFVEHDQCQRMRTWGDRYQPFRVTLHYAMNVAIRDALIANDATVAYERVMGLAVRPGVEISTPHLFDAMTHHARLAEVLAQYLLSAEEFDVIDTISAEWGEYQPNSFLLPDGRLWRIVLTSRWNKQREDEERMSWRTVADVSITNRPMLITALVMGSAKEGFRPSPWTQGYLHPTNGALRIQRREGPFSSTWRKTYREQTDFKPLEWLKMMQQDGAIAERVFSITQDATNRREVVDAMNQMALEMKFGSTRQTRAACFVHTPCQFLPACLNGKTPPQLGWVEKDSLSSTPHAILPVISG